MKERSLIRQSKAGKPEAFEELLQLYSEQMYKMAFRYVSNREDALDIVQETAYKAYLAIPNLKKDHYFSTWLMRILIHTAFECLRKKRPQVDIDSINERVFVEEIDRIEHLQLMEALQELRSDYRDVLVLFYLHDLPVKQVAKVMRLPVGTVKTHLRRGKEELKKNFERRRSKWTKNFSR